MEEIKDLLDEFGDDIYNFCRYLAKNKEDSEDLFQETILKTIELSSKIDKNKNPKSFIISISINLWKNAVRKKNRRNIITRITHITEENSNYIVDETTNVENSVIKSLTNISLIDSINDLDDKYRIPIILFYLESMKISEIAKVLDKPEGTIKRQLHQGREKLKKELEAIGYE